MGTYLALLRGINISGQKIIKMENLRRLLEQAGYQNVETYIQSGNIVFDSDMQKEELAVAIKSLIAGNYGFDVAVFVYDVWELDAIVSGNPFSEGAVPEPAGTKKLYVTFLEQAPTDARLTLLQQAPLGEDLIALHGNVLYFKLANGAAASKLSNNLIEAKLKVIATTRNWNTTLKLASMLHARQ